MYGSFWGKDIDSTTVKVQKGVILWLRSNQLDSPICEFDLWTAEIVQGKRLFPWCGFLMSVKKPIGILNEIAWDLYNLEKSPGVINF